MREALVVLESYELGNIHRSIVEGLKACGLPVWPLVLPRDGCATPEENTTAVAMATKAADLVILIGPNDHLTEPALAEAYAEGKRIVSIQIDDPWAIDGGRVRLTGYYHEVLTSAVSSIAAYKALGAEAACYLPFGFDPQVFRPVPVPHMKGFGILFLGSAYGKRVRRLQMLKARGLNVVCAGPGNHPAWQIKRRFPAWALPGMFQSAQVCLNFADQPDGTPGMKIRPFEVAGCGGGVLLTERWPGCEELFTDGEECVYFDTDQDLADKVAALLADETARKRISAAACERAHRDHTWEQRLRPHVQRWREAL